MHTSDQSTVNYRTYKTTNCWRSVDTHFTVLSIQCLLPSTIDFIIIWTSWSSLWQIETWPCGKAKCSNILALFALTRLKFMCLAKRFIPPAVYLFINRYSHAIAHHSPMIYLQLKLLGKIHKEAGETLTHSVILFLHSLIPPRFKSVDHHQHLFSLSLWLPCSPNQLGNIWRGAHIPLLRAFRILNAIVLLQIRFNVCCATVFAVIWII